MHLDESDLIRVHNKSARIEENEILEGCSVADSAAVGNENHLYKAINLNSRILRASWHQGNAVSSYDHELLF